MPSVKISNKTPFINFILEDTTKQTFKLTDHGKTWKGDLKVAIDNFFTVDSEYWKYYFLDNTFIDELKYIDAMSVI